MRLVQWFSLPAAILGYCCAGAMGAGGVYAPNSYTAPEPDVAACSYSIGGDSHVPIPYGSAGHDGCTSCDSCSSCGTVCFGLFPCRHTGDPWTLQSFLTGDSACYSYGGWVSAGAYANAHGHPNNGPIGMRDVGDGFTVDQVWGFFERSADTGGCGWNWGFRADFVFGADGPDTQAFGSDPRAYDNPWDTSRDYGSALPQLYGEVAVNNLSVKMGHFFTIIGYEGVPVVNNFFYSHSYAMYFGEPFTHTGVLAEYNYSDNLTFWGGWVQGWDTGFDNPRGSNDFIGGVRASLTDAVSLAWAATAGRDDIDNSEYYVQSIVADFSLTKRLNYVLQSDWGSISNSQANGQWYGINNHLFYTINPCWAAGMRFEWFRDDDGLRIPQGAGAAGDYYGLTWGVNWKPRPNLRFRPELRYDWAQGGVQPFDGGRADDQLSGGFDFIVTF